MDKSNQADETETQKEKDDARLRKILNTIRDILLIENQLHPNYPINPNLIY